MITLIGFALATLAVAWLTAAATVVRSVSRLWLRRRAEEQLGGSATALQYLEYPQRLLLGANACGAVVVFVAGALASGIAGDRVLGVVPVVLVGGAVVLVGGHMLPRVVARRWATAMAPILLPPLRSVTHSIGPLNAVGERLARPHVPSAMEVTGPERDLLEDLLREGVLEGVAARDEMDIISGIAQFGERRVGEVMTPRDQVFALEEQTPLAELCAQIALSGYSRVPLYRGSLDDITGMVLAFDLLSGGVAGAPLLRPVATAAATQVCNRLLVEMLRQSRHLAVVTDGGRTVGIVTLEDLLEELVGDIRDEHDEPDSVPSPAGG